MMPSHSPKRVQPVSVLTLLLSSFDASVSACKYQPADGDCADQLCSVGLNPRNYRYPQQAQQHPLSLAYRIARFRLLLWVSVAVWPHSSGQASSCSLYHSLTVTL